MPAAPSCSHAPNAIGAGDWCGWTKERGLYFASAWDASYVPLLAMSDPGETPLHGALVSGCFGAGRHTHCALALHTELDALVPGAFRLLANLDGTGSCGLTVSPRFPFPGTALVDRLRRRQIGSADGGGSNGGDRRCGAEFGLRRPASRARRRSRGRAGRVRRHSRLVGLRQDHAAAHHRRLPEGARGRVSACSAGTSTDHAAREARPRDGVPVLCAVAAHDRARQHRLRPEAARTSRATRSPGASPTCSPCSTCRPRGAQGDGPVRRPAPARRARPGACHRAAHPAARRAAVQSRRQGAAAAARRDQGAAAQTRLRRDPRHARPRGGHDHGRPHRRHGSRAGSRRRARRRRSTTGRRAPFIASFMGAENTIDLDVRAHGGRRRDPRRWRGATGHLDRRACRRAACAPIFATTSARHRRRRAPQARHDRAARPHRLARLSRRPLSLHASPWRAAVHGQGRRAIGRSARAVSLGLPIKDLHIFPIAGRQKIRRGNSHEKLLAAPGGARALACRRTGAARRPSTSPPPATRTWSTTSRTILGPMFEKANPGVKVVAVGTGPGDGGSQKIYEKLSAQKKAGTDKWDFDVIVVHQKMAGQMVGENLLADYATRSRPASSRRATPPRTRSAPTCRASSSRCSTARRRIAYNPGAGQGRAEQLRRARRVDEEEPEEVRLQRHQGRHVRRRLRRRLGLRLRRRCRQADERPLRRRDQGRLGQARSPTSRSSTRTS